MKNKIVYILSQISFTEKIQFIYELSVTFITRNSQQLNELIDDWEDTADVYTNPYIMGRIAESRKKLAH